MEARAKEAAAQVEKLKLEAVAAVEKAKAAAAAAAAEKAKPAAAVAAVDGANKAGSAGSSDGDSGKAGQKKKARGKSSGHRTGRVAGARGGGEPSESTKKTDASVDALLRGLK
jgi:hypothetical protein